MGKRDDKGRFVAGQSGNPGGRPKGIFLAAELQDFLNQGGRKSELIQKLYKRAVEGEDMQAMRLIFQYTDGLPTQRIEGEFAGTLTASPEWQQIRANILGIVERHPDIKEALLDVFDDRSTDGD